MTKCDHCGQPLLVNLSDLPRRTPKFVFDAGRCPPGTGGAVDLETVSLTRPSAPDPRGSMAATPPPPPPPEQTLSEWVRDKILRGL